VREAPNWQKPDATFWAGKRVVVTGHSGFKGSWLTLWLSRLGARVTGISLAPITTPDLFTSSQLSGVCDSHFLDIRDAMRLASVLQKVRPEIIFHLAAQPLVRASYRDPVETFTTNVQGTTNLLQALRYCDETRVAVIVTTDKVYTNREWVWPYRESDSIGGRDPYSASKAASELIIDSYRDSFLTAQGLSVSSARAGNVIGGGDWSEDRLLPDAIRAWKTGGELYIRNPDATRPWQHVLEPISGYLGLANAMWKKPELSGPYNFGPDSVEGGATVRHVIDLARKAFGSGKVRYEQASVGPHEAGMLALDVSKAKMILGVRSRLTLEQSVFETMRWYRDFYSGESARELCFDDIERFEELL
jgi:CDP-glucose 4,6-dehydratase